jgi:CRISPR-associated protein Cas5d
MFNPSTTESREICIDVWGNDAMFTMPSSPVERVSYKVPTPSACRGILNSIMQKPKQFYYQITAIEVMKPIRTRMVKRNEVKKKMREDAPIDTNKERTQRMNIELCDVYYRIHAKIVKRPDAERYHADGENKEVSVIALQDMFNRYVKRGQFRKQPCFGCREHFADFSLPNYDMKPIRESMDLGVMLYDVFDITDNRILKTGNRKACDSTYVTFYHAKMENGVIKVPEWGDESICHVA